MNSHNHLLKLSAFLIYIIQFTRSQINYDSDPLHFARLRLEEKLSSNLFLGNIVMDQEEDDASCSSEHGPFCSFINEKSLNYLKRTTDDVYYHSLKNSTLRDLKDTIKYAKRSIGEKGGFPALKGGHEIIFYPTTRMRLDQALYPNNYPAVHTYTFTFQSFKTETGKLRSFDADVDFDLDTSMFI
jgi:hypothetical protein